MDGNVDYDDLNAMEQDQQEDYFGSESPQTVMDEDSNGSCQNGLTYESESRTQSPEMMKSEPTWKVEASLIWSELFLHVYIWSKLF